MPILANAKKALRVSKRKAVVNQRIRSRSKKAVDAVKKTPSLELLTAAYKAIDKAVKRNLFHANKGSRLKSQLASLVKASGAKATKKVAKAAPKATAKKKSTSKKAATKSK